MNPSSEEPRISPAVDRALLRPRPLKKIEGLDELLRSSRSESPDAPSAPPRWHPSGVQIVESSQVPKGKMYLFPQSRLVIVPPRPAPNALDRLRLRARRLLRKLLSR